MMEIRFLTFSSTESKINFCVRKTKYIPTQAAAIGNPTSVKKFKKSIEFYTRK
jgi:hypothetical protein